MLAHLRKPVVFLIFFSIFAAAEGTRTWEQSKFDDLSKGTANGVALRSAGGLELAPSFKSIFTTPSAYIWAIAADSRGNLYAAAGSPARVYRITPDGKSSVVFEPQELQVQALAVDKNGVIYAATNPDGKVYRIEHHANGDAPNARDKSADKGQNHGTDSKSPDEKPKTPVAPGWTSTVYFDPETKYIWDLTLDSSGNLYVATGDHGEIFRVDAKGEHSVFFTSDEAHIRVLALDHKGNVIAGSDGSGLVYRIAPDGNAFVLYSAAKKEITALAVDDAGNIYAAGVGEKKAGSTSASSFSPVLPQSPAPSVSSTQSPGMVITSAPPPPSVSMANFPAPGGSATGGSEIYRIAPDGSPTRLWTSHEDLVYALAFDPEGHLLVGTGNRGHVFAVEGEDEFSDLLKASANQVTAFAPAPGRGLYVASSNLGKVFLMGPSPESEGTYESDVLDAHIFSRWGRAEFAGAGKVELFARSGNVDNPDRNWSAWQKVALQGDAEIMSPPARFIQWKAVLHAGSAPPRVDSITLNYLPKNVAPDFDDVSVQLGVRFQPIPKMAGSEAGGSQGSANPSQPHFDVPVPTVHDRDSIGVKWSVHDDNDDDMVYSIYFRGDGDSRWLLLKDNLTDKFYSFDASLLPDGGYTIKIVASDAPSHSPGDALTAEKESGRFEVDTTPPRIENLSAAADGREIHVSFLASDSFSPIKRAECSIDAGDWQFVEPTDKLSDAKTERYDFKMPVPADSGADPGQHKPEASSEHVVVVRAYDRFDNMSSAKTVIRGK